MLTCPFILLNLSSTGAVSKVATVSLSLWLDFYISCHVDPTMLQYLHLDVCVLPSPYRAFMIKLLLPFSTIVGTVCNETHPNFWHSVVINHVIRCSFPSMRNILIAVLNSALIHLTGWHCVTFYCAFSVIHLCCKLTPNGILQLCNLQQKQNLWIFTVSHLCCLFTFLNVTLRSFFGNLISCSWVSKIFNGF